MKVRRSLILNVFKKARLRELADTLDVHCCASSTRIEILQNLEKSRVFTTRRLLDQLSRRELEAACLTLGRTPAGRSKVALIASLTGDKAELLRASVVGSLKAQGFKIHKGKISIPDGLDKSSIRRLHQLAVEHKRERAKDSLARNEPHLLARIANGQQVSVEAVSPRLQEVVRGTDDELLFRYACLHWSIPVSSGYGRRLRFLIIDANNEKLIGVLGLGDPVFALQPRDAWIGWSAAARSSRLHNVVDAFVLGAVPPYSFLLGGKLVAMLAASNEVRSAFRQKYAGRATLIAGKTLDGEIALLTTTSALGRSSIYNRIKVGKQTIYERVGYTRGFGDFQFLNGLYDELSEFAHLHCEATAKNESWGTGFRNRREIVKKSLDSLGLSPDLLCHGVQREVFVTSLAENTKEFLCGQNEKLTYFDRPAEAVFAEFRARWLLPRAAREPRFRSFDRQAYRLWDL